MSTYEELYEDAKREEMLDRCEALHADLDIFDRECSGCEDRMQQAIEDEDPDQIYRLIEQGARVPDGALL